MPSYASSVNLDGMFVISKNEVDGLDPRKTYVPGEASGRSWEWKIGLINNLDLGYKVNDFKEFYVFRFLIISTDFLMFSMIFMNFTGFHSF